MDVIEELYQQVISGEIEAPSDLRSRRILLHRAKEQAASAELQARRDALTVATLLGERDGIEVITVFLGDPEPELRNEALDVGITSGHEGLILVREAAKVSDEPLALRAIAHLSQTKDGASTRVMRELLESDSPRVREAAVTLLGHLAGPAVLRDVEPLLDDDDADVRFAAEVARARLRGDDIPTAPSRPAAEPTPAPPSPAPPPPRGAAPLGLPPAAAAGSQGADDTMDALRSATNTANVGNQTAPAGEGAENTTLAVIEPPAAGGLWEPDSPAALPGSLPTEALALVRLLGIVAWRDRAKVIDALRQVPNNDVAAVVSGYRAGGDPPRGRGVAIAAASMGNTRWVTALRQMLKDPDPSVRACVLIALAGLAGPSLLPQMGQQATAVDPRVRAACAFALGESGARLGAQSMVERYLEALRGDADPSVVEAATAATKAISP